MLENTIVSHAASAFGVETTWRGMPVAALVAILAFAFAPIVAWQAFGFAIGGCAPLWLLDVVWAWAATAAL